MIRIHLTPEDLSQMRFAFSPLWEVIAGYRVFLDPARHALHLPWAANARRALRGVDLSPIGALVRPQGYIPNFLTPPPTTPIPEFTAEMTRLRAIPREMVVAEIEHFAQDCPRPSPALCRYLAEPGRAMDELVVALSQYWQRALASHWPRLQTLLEGDVLYRVHTLAFAGPEAVFVDLHQGVRYRAQRTQGTIEIATSYEHDLHAAGRGMLLIPVVFAWPDRYVISDPPWQPALVYTPRGVARLWSRDAPAADEALGVLLGPGRAAVLQELAIPCTTGELARRLSITPGAVSQHLAVLRRAGVIEPHRQGRHVFHRLTPFGISLLRLFEGAAKRSL